MCIKEYCEVKKEEQEEEGEEEGEEQEEEGEEQGEEQREEQEEEQEIKKKQEEEVKYIYKINDFFKVKKIMNKVIFNQINNLCYFFAYLEMYFKNVKKIFYFFKNKILKNENKKTYCNIYFINNGSIILNIKIENENDFKNIKYKEIEETLNYDIIILNKNKNYLTFYNIEELKNVNLNEEEEEVKYSFINIEMFYKEKIYDIKLKKKDEYNYLFNKNKINKYFFQYFLKNNYNLNENFNEDNKYNIELIDNNINIINMNEKQELILCNNNYIIQ